MRVILLLLLAVSAVATGGELRWNLNSRPALISEAVALAKEVDTASSEVVFVLRRHAISLKPEGVVTRVDLVYLYPTVETVQDSGVDSISWNVSLEDLVILESSVVAADGRRQQFDPATVSIQDNNSYDVLTDQKDVVMQLPGVSPGSISVLSYEKRISNLSEFFFSTYLKSSTEIHRVDIDVSWSTGKPAWHMDEADYDCTETANRFSCSATQVPSVDLETNQFVRDVLPMFTLATARSWQELIDEMLNKIRPALSDDSGLSELTEQFKLQENPLSSAVELASRQVRYVSFSEGEYSRTPHAVSQTLENRYGDCKDKSTLLLATLKRLGVDAYPVLISTRREDPGRLMVPGLGYFDHMVVCADIEGSERCFDPTDSVSGADVTAWRLQGKVRLNLLPNSKPETIARDPHLWQFEVVNQYRFGSDGGQSEELELVYRGAYGNWIRSRLMSQSNDEQEEWVTNQYIDSVATDTELNIELIDLENLSEPVVIKLSSKFSPFVNTERNLDYEDRMGWVDSFLSGQKFDYETSPGFFDGAMIRSTATFDLNGIWTDPEFGAAVNFDSAFGSLTQSFELSDRNVVVKTVLDLPARKISSHEMPQFHRFLDLASAEMRYQFWAKRVLAK